MPDPTPPPQPDPNPKKRKRGVLNAAQAKELTKGEQIGMTAQKSAHAAKLAARNITAAYVTTLLDTAKLARDKSAQAVQSTTSKESATLTETVGGKDLMIAIQEVQTAAKQKYARTDPTKMRDYYIGKKLNESRALLEQYSEGIINKLGSDTLPGITAAKITDLGDLRATWIADNSAQGAKQSDATDARTDLADLVKAVTDARITVMFAADGEYPYTNKANAAQRREFQLPPNGPFNG
ncbi:MAG: hypothetical protein HY300_19660 [Verrucomicrobia bacterium]|nr:hypothetical protein [Verrucomicrobiota bacterium]